MGRSAEDPQKRDGSIDDPGILAYLRQLTGSLVAAAGVQPVDIRITRSAKQYASLLPNRILYMSSGLLNRIDNEAELAGLLAHQLAHGRSLRSLCILASPLPPSLRGDQRERELESTAAAISIVKLVGYDPAGVLDLLSKLAFEHPAWAKAIDSDDLLNLRLRVESQPVPGTGYRLDSTDFVQVHRTLKGILGVTAARSRHRNGTRFASQALSISALIARDLLQTKADLTSYCDTKGKDGI